MEAGWSGRSGRNVVDTHVVFVNVFVNVLDLVGFIDNFDSSYKY
jgi:hypothetical protein